jgi:hypothetical protein
MITRAPRPKSNFYILDKRISEDANLSWASRGLLVYLLGKPDHWQVSVQALINETSASSHPLGRDGVRGLITELMSAGYVQRTAARGEGGKLAGYDYIVAETCTAPKAVLPSTVSPGPDKPSPVEPGPVNPPLVSIEEETRIEKKARIEGEKPAQALAIPPALLADFLVVRKAKRAGPLTATAIAGLQREADKAGISLEAAVTACCEYGWQGFNAGWYAARAPKPAAMTANRQTETAHMRQEREVAQGLAPNVARVKLVPTFDFVEMEKSNVALINRN